MRHATFLAIFLTFPNVCFAQTTWHVPDEFATIQEAISDVSVVHGDTIIVRPGIYVENIDFLGKAISVQSEFGPEETVIDGNQFGSVVTCQSGEGSDSRLGGFTITNGKTIPIDVGGGMYNRKSSPTVTDCTFFGNEGHGMYNLESSPTVTNCCFSENWYTGMYNKKSSLTVTRCFISGNGPGIWDEDSITTLIHCTLYKNGGGGVEARCSSLTVSHCSFIQNCGAGGFGGGIDYFGGGGTVTNSTFYGNTADWGGGISIDGSNVSVINCTFFRNKAYRDESYWKSNSGVGGGIYGIGTVTNCILWENKPDQASSSNTVTYSCVQGGFPGTGNVDSDPLFADPENGDLHLSFTSPCRNLGNNSAVNELYDFEGDPRIANVAVDMGADEFYPHLYCDGDTTPGDTLILKFYGVQGILINSLIIRTNLFDPSLPCACGDWYIDDPFQVLFGIDTIPTDGANILSVPIGLTPPAPYTIYMQGIIDKWLTNPCTVNVQ